MDYIWRYQLVATFLYSPLLRWAILTRKVGHIDLVFGVRSGFISRSVCACHIKYLCAAVTICVTVNDI